MGDKATITRGASAGPVIIRRAETLTHQLAVGSTADQAVLIITHQFSGNLSS